MLWIRQFIQSALSKNTQSLSQLETKDLPMTTTTYDTASCIIIMVWHSLGNSMNFAAFLIDRHYLIYISFVIQSCSYLPGKFLSSSCLHPHSPGARQRHVDTSDTASFVADALSPNGPPIWPNRIHKRCEKPKYPCSRNDQRLKDQSITTKISKNTRGKEGL